MIIMLPQLGSYYDVTSLVLCFESTMMSLLKFWTSSKIVVAIMEIQIHVY